MLSELYCKIHVKFLITLVTHTLNKLDHAFESQTFISQLKYPALLSTKSLRI